MMNGTKTQAQPKKIFYMTREQELNAVALLHKYYLRDHGIDTDTIEIIATWKDEKEDGR